MVSKTLYEFNDTTTQVNDTWHFKGNLSLRSAQQWNLLTLTFLADIGFAKKWYLNSCSCI